MVDGRSGPGERAQSGPPHVRVGATLAVAWLVLGGCARLGAPVPVFERPSGTLVLAHRGGALEAPENTLSALRHAVQAGAHWIEIDVRLTRDGVPVVMHDETVDRMTDGVGRIDALTLEEIRRLRLGAPALDAARAERLVAAGIRLADPALDERVPTLDEVLAVPGAHLMLELKRTPASDALARAVVERVHAARAGGRVAVASFEPRILDAVHDLDPALPLIGIAADATSLAAHLQRPVAVAAVRTDLVRRAVEVVPAGVAVWVWTVELPTEAHALAERGVDGVITDAPAAVLKGLGRRTVEAR